MHLSGREMGVNKHRLLYCISQSKTCSVIGLINYKLASGKDLKNSMQYSLI